MRRDGAGIQRDGGTPTSLTLRERFCVERSVAHATKSQPFTIPWGNPREAYRTRKPGAASLERSAARSASYQGRRAWAGGAGQAGQDRRYNTAMPGLIKYGFVLFGVFALGSACGAGCDRACLKTTLDQYLNAVVQHNPSAAPLSVGYRETENAMVRRPGGGLWKSAKELGKIQRKYFDAESGQAGYFGTLEEESGTDIVTVRLKVDDRKISEAEWYVSRKGDAGIGVSAGAQANAAFHDPDYLTARIT